MKLTRRKRTKRGGEQRNGRGGTVTQTQTPPKKILAVRTEGGTDPLHPAQGGIVQRSHHSQGGRHRPSSLVKRQLYVKVFSQERKKIPIK